MICPKCGKELPDGSSFCGYCGENLTVPAAEEIETEPVQIPEAEPVQEETAEPAAPAKSVDFAAIFKPEEFKPLLDVLKNPFASHEISLIPAVVLIVAEIILNWVAFRQLGGFVTGLLITLVLLVGAILLMVISNVKNINLVKYLGKAAAILLVPAILAFLAGLLSGFESSFMLWICAALLILSILVYIFAVEKNVPNISKYLLSVLFAVILLFAAYLLYKGIIRSIDSMFGMMWDF